MEVLHTPPQAAAQRCRKDAEDEVTEQESSTGARRAFILKEGYPYVKF